ncbi:MAG: ribonuclease III [Lachnospiraceae bacterium]|nr:ribonuclease III [Lachnospiraceae bacterium]
MADNFFLKEIEDIAGKGANPKELSPLVLAYVGDSVFELIIRTYVVFEGTRHVKELNIISDKMVNAKAQSDLYNTIKDMLTDEEAAVYRRGRNAKISSSAKNATLADYKRATGLEALFGYLYLSGDIKRAMELFKSGMENLKE